MVFFVWQDVTIWQILTWKARNLYCRGFMSGITQNANCYAICRYNLLTTDFLKPNFNDVCILCETSSMLRNNGDSRKNKSGDLILSRSGAHSTRHFQIVTVCNQSCANRVFYTRRYALDWPQVLAQVTQSMMLSTLLLPLPPSIIIKLKSHPSRCVQSPHRFDL